MIPMSTDPGLLLVWCALWLALAALVRVAAGRVLAASGASGATAAVYDWMFNLGLRRGVRQLRHRGWDGRHGLRCDALVAALHAGTVEVAELEAQRPRPDARTTGLKSGGVSAEDQRRIDELQADVEKYREEVRTDRGLLAAAVQQDTMLIPLVVLDPAARYAAETTRDWFAPGDAAILHDDAEFEWTLHQLLADADGTLSGDDIGHAAALLRLARGGRDSTGTGEHRIIIPRQRPAAVAS